MSPVDESPSRPNILFIISDDHGRFYSGCYGNATIATPNIDRLAREGMRFDSAFTANPVCGPSRSVAYTGLYPFRNGAHSNGDGLDLNEGVKTLPHYMNALGYRTALAGKRHIQPESRWPFDYLDFDAAHDFLCEPHERPFCLVAATKEPHTPWPDESRFDPDAIALPPYLIDTPETRQAAARYYEAVARLDERVGELLATLDEAGLADNTLVIYTTDHGEQFPFAKWTLYDAGIRLPCIARWPGRVEAGSVCEALIQHTDFVPTFIEAAGGRAPDDLDGQSFLSLLQGGTTMTHGRIYATHTNTGLISGLPASSRCVRTERHKYIANLHPYTTVTNCDTNGHERRNTKEPPTPKAYWVSWLRRAESDAHVARHCLRYQHRPAEELYDLALDPDETVNLAQSESHAERLAELRAELRDWMERQGDPGLDYFDERVAGA